MKIMSAKFVKGINGSDPILDDPKPQIAVIGRSNVGKSSLINSLTGVKDLAITSSFPGRTQQINLFLINLSFYLVDLPGYGFARGSRKDTYHLEDVIRWYLFESNYNQKAIILIIDASVGMTANDREMLQALEARQKNIIIVANKVDKIKSSEYVRKMRDIEAAVGTHRVIPYSSEPHIGQAELADVLFS